MPKNYFQYSLILQYCTYKYRPLYIVQGRFFLHLEQANILIYTTVIQGRAELFGSIGTEL